MRLSADDLLRLARAYSDHADLSLVTVGVKATNNDKVFMRLASGRTCTVRTLERAALWFAEHWPADLAWPAGVPHPHRPCGGAPEISAPANCDGAPPQMGGDSL